MLRQRLGFMIQQHHQSNDTPEKGKGPPLDKRSVGGVLVVKSDAPPAALKGRHEVPQDALHDIRTLPNLDEYTRRSPQ